MLSNTCRWSTRYRCGERRCPRPDDGHDYRPFLKALKAIGYAGTISLPGDADAAGLEYCRRLWRE